MNYIHLRPEITVPTLILSHPTGIIYHNQVDGLSCRQESIEGFIYPLYATKKVTKHKFFNPRWWYSQYGYNYDNLRTICGIFTPNRTITTNELDLVLRQGSANGLNNNLKEWKYWNKFKRFIYVHFDLKVREELPCMEAWIPVSTRINTSSNYLQDPKDFVNYDGVLTWRNCD